MRKRINSIIIVLCMLLLFCGCHSSKETIQNQKNTFDINSNQSYWGDNFIKKSEKGYYYIFNSRLYFLDKKTMESVLVCTVPDCKHQDEYCTAYIGTYGDKLQYSFLDFGLEITDKYIYIIGSEESQVTDFYLYRISRDGTEKEKLFYLYSTDKNYMFYEYKMHRENLYRAVITEEKKCLEKTSLDGKVSTIIDLSQYNSVFLDTIQGYENFVYFDASWYEDEEKKNMVSRVYRYNIDTNKVEVVLEDFICNGYQIVDNTCIVYMDMDYNIKKKSIETGKETIIRLTDGKYSVFSFDGTNVYFHNNVENKIEVHSLEGKNIDNIEINNGNCYFGDSDYLFVSAIPNKNSEYSESCGLYVFDKKQIGSGKQEWKGIGYYRD